MDAGRQRRKLKVMRNCKKWCLFILPVLICGMFPGNLPAESREEISFYVSPGGSDSYSGTQKQPFKTIQRAQEAVRQKIEKGLNNDLVVNIDGGVYKLSDTLYFDRRDSGTDICSVTYQASGGQRPVISGGREIKGWVQGENNVWRAYIDDVKKGLWEFRDLFADGERLTRARFPNIGMFMTVDNVEDVKVVGATVARQKITADRQFPGGNLAITGTEIVMKHIWTVSRNRVMHVHDKVITSAHPIGCYGFPYGEAKAGRPFYLEHAKEFIDVPGEWYLDRDTGTVYYMAAENENPNDRSFVAPYVDKIIFVEGERNGKVKNLHFKGIDFEYSGWTLPLEGYGGVFAGHYMPRWMRDASYAVPLAVHMEYTDGVVFEQCRLAHTGASGFGLGKDCDNNKILGCEITDIGGNGIHLGWKEKADEPPRFLFENGWDDESDAPQNNEISHNNIYDCSLVQDAAGIFSAFSGYTKVTHNWVHDLPYIGIATGYVWNDYKTTQHHALIAYNRVNHVMTQLEDGGGIYLLGYQPGTKIINNLVHDVIKGRAFYNDGFSAHLYYENNISYRTLDAFCHKGHHHTVKNNIFASTQYGLIYVAPLH